MDELLVSHNEFLGNCLTQLMVDKEHLLKILTKLLVICEEFAKFSRAFFESISKDMGASDGTTVCVPSPSSSRTVRGTTRQIHHE